MTEDLKEEPGEAKPEPPKLFLLFRLNYLEHIGVILGLLTVIGIFRFDSITRITTHYLGGFQGDAGLYIWLTNLNTRSIFQHWFETPGFYPYGQSLAWSDNFILPSLLVKALLMLGLTQPLAFNLMMLFAQFLTGYFALFLFYRLSGETLNAFSVGCIFSTLCYFTFNLGHPQLQFFFWIPLSLLFLIYFVNSGRIVWAITCGLSIFGCFLTAVYYAIFCVICLGVFLAAILILRPMALSRRNFYSLAIGGAAGFSPVIPFVFPYFQVRDTFGSRQIYEAFYFAASPLSYLSSTPYNLLYEVTALLSHSEAHFFPGFAVLILSAMAIMRLGDARQLKPRLNAVIIAFLVLSTVLAIWPDPIGRFFGALLAWTVLILFVRLIFLLGSLERKLKFETMTVRDLIAIFSFIALVFFVLSLGPLGNPNKGQMAFAPYRVLYEIMPGFDSLRAISRAGVMALFAMVFLFALELSYLSTRRKLGTAILLPMIFVLIENYSFTYPIESEPAKPQAVQALEALSPHAATIVLPFAGKLDTNNEIISWSEFARLHTTYLNWLLPSGVRIVNGYSGQRTKLMKELPRELKGFPDTRAWQAISRIGGVQYIIYVASLDRQYNASEFQKRLRESSNAIKLLGHYDDESYLLEIAPEIKIDEDLFIWLPSKAGSGISFDLRAAPAVNQTRARAEVFMKDDFDLIQLQTIETDANGSWQKYSLRLPPVENRVRPVQVTFVPQMGAELFLRNLVFHENVR